MKRYYLVIIFFSAFYCKGQVPSSFQLFDNFNRNDSVKVGVPAGSTYEYWLEYGEVNFGCTAAQNISLRSNTMRLSRYDWGGSGCFNNSAKAVNAEMTYKYNTVFSDAPGRLEWYFNMQQNHPDPNGFGTGKNGMAFVVGCNLSDPTSGSPKGYAVIFGDDLSDRIKLVSFQSSFASASFTEIVSVAGPVNKNDHMSIRVTFDPCTNVWSLRMRNDGASFTDPSGITGEPLAAETGINTTHINVNLPWIGAILSHSTDNFYARYDNVYIPDGNTIGSYVWNGSVSTDFQLSQNWTPARNCIKSGDRLLFNSLSPATSVVTNIPVQTVRQLWVSDARSVVLKDVDNASSTTLTITGAAGADLKVDAGSSITLDVAGANPANAMVISLNTGVTGNIAGDFIFNNSLYGGDNSHRLLASDPNALTIASGGRVFAKHLSGNPFGNTGNQNTVVFTAGAIYQNESGDDPFALAAPQSKVLFNRGSTYRHFTDNSFSAAGRTYANVVVNANTEITAGSAALFLTADSVLVSGGTFNITGALNNEPVNFNIRGNLSVNPGAVFNYDAVVPSTFTYNSNFTQQRIKNAGILTTGNLVTVKLMSIFASPQLIVENDFNIKGILLITQGILHLEGDIHLKSDASRTASVAPLVGSITYGAGRFIIERFISANKGWRFLNAPVLPEQNIRSAWQENSLPGINSNPGFGTIITSNIAGNGFDIFTPGGPSMKTYTSSTGSWTGIPNTTTESISNKKGFMLMVRGDRSVINYNDPPTETILRSRGKLYAPGAATLPPYTTVLPGKLESIGNPYASAIDFNLVTKGAGIQNIFYIWDPLLAGSYGLGGYQTFTYISSAYVVTPGGGSYSGSNRYIESGQSFLVKNTGTGNANVSFTEVCKVTASSQVNRGNNVIGLGLNLYIKESGKAKLADGVLSVYTDVNPQENAEKLFSGGESVSINSHSTDLSASFKKFSDRDTIFYHLQSLRIREYELEIVRNNFSGKHIYLVDRYLGTKVLLPSQDSVRINFSVTSDQESSRKDRFYIIYKQDVGISATNSFTVYPNPIEDNVIQLHSGDISAGNYSISLTDQSGKVIRIYNLSVSSYTDIFRLNVSGLPAGVYNLTISQKGFTKTVRIIK